MPKQAHVFIIEPVVLAFRIHSIVLVHGVITYKVVRFHHQMDSTRTERKESRFYSMVFSFYLNLFLNTSLYQITQDSIPVFPTHDLHFPLPCL